LGIATLAALAEVGGIAYLRGVLTRIGAARASFTGDLRCAERTGCTRGMAWNALAGTCFPPRRGRRWWQLRLALDYTQLGRQLEAEGVEGGAVEVQLPLCPAARGR
jgi:hypothetical protein